MDLLKVSFTIATISLSLMFLLGLIPDSPIYNINFNLDGSPTLLGILQAIGSFLSGLAATIRELKK